MLKKLILVLLAAILLQEMSLMAQEEQPLASNTEKKELTHEERIEALNNILMNRGDILALIPGIAIKSGENGNFIEYTGVPIEKLDPVAFDELYQTTFRHVNQKNIENTLRQLKQLEQINNYNRSQRTIRQLNNRKRNY